MITEIGLFALFFSFIAAIYAIIALVYGERRKNEAIVLSGRNAALLNFGLVSLSAGMLMLDIIFQNYQVQYVWSVTSPDMPMFFRLTALWGSQQGSLLFWTMLMSGFSAGAVLLNWKVHRRLMPYATAYMMAVVIFFAGITLFFENPFARWWYVPTADQPFTASVLRPNGAYPANDVSVAEFMSAFSAQQRAFVSISAQIIPNDVALPTQAVFLRASDLLPDVLVPSAMLMTSQALPEMVRAGDLPADTSIPFSAVSNASFVLRGDLPATAQIAPVMLDPNMRLDLVSYNAKGLNPLLRHFGMAIHPPMLYLGFVGFIVLFAFAMSALASGDLSTNWIKASHRWTLFAWLCLSLGLILGGRWAYDVLGWGGYWGWDPVENAAFLPWLMGTAFIHSVMIQEKRGMLKTWNMVLAVGTFSAVIFGTFATRSGLVESVHSFARSEIGFPMFFFWLIVTIVSVWLILWRRSRGELRDEHPFTNLLSRESLFVLNNLIFMALFIAIFWGSFGAPIVSEIFLDTNITLGKDYFIPVVTPLFIALYLLMGIAPLSAWGATSLKRLGRSVIVPLALTIVSLGLFIGQATDKNGVLNILAWLGYGLVLFSGWVAIYETYRGAVARIKAHGESLPVALYTLLRRNPRRYGGYLIHLGITVIGIGVIGSTVFQQETQQTLTVGETLAIADYQVRYDGLEQGQISQDGRIMDIANLTLIRNGQEIAHLRPRRDFFPNAGEGMNSMTISGAHSTIENDFYVLLVSWEPISASSATFKVYINPLVNLVWWGGIVLIFGTVFSFFPKETLPERIRQRVQKAETLGLKGVTA
jgi:cytochrome c-type biogenesis protein CcmF